MKLKLITNYYDYQQQILDFIKEYSTTEAKMVPSVLRMCNSCTFDEYVEYLNSRATRNLKDWSQPLCISLWMKKEISLLVQSMFVII